MKKKIITLISNNFYLILFLVISLLCSFLILWLNNRNILAPGLDIIQHLLTVASIVLGVITLNLSIILSIREGFLYIRIKNTRKDILMQLFGYATSAIISSAIVIFISLIILSTIQLIYEYKLYRSICIVCISWSFIYMIICTAMSFIQSIQMLKLDDENQQ